MKQNLNRIQSYFPWLILLLGVNAFAALLLWIADARAFSSMAAVLLLFTLLFFSSLCTILVRLERRIEQMFLSLLQNPDAYHEELLQKAAAPSRRASVHRLAENLRDRQDACTKLQMQLHDYEEYVESWAHETKIPLSLLTLFLDNRREELPAAAVQRLDYIRNRMQESIDQMLFYARLKSTRKDYLLEHLSIRSCVEEVLEDYRPLLEEKGFWIHSDLPETAVCSDRRGLHFLLSQIISNAIKYSGTDPRLSLAFSAGNNCCILSIRDNGTGVRPCDLPYIFEKGFTGDPGRDRKQATGMGLDLAHAMAEDLNLTLQARSRWKCGFEMQILFPVVKETSPRRISSLQPDGKT